MKFLIDNALSPRVARLWRERLARFDSTARCSAASDAVATVRLSSEDDPEAREYQVELRSRELAHALGEQCLVQGDDL